MWGIRFTGEPPATCDKRGFLLDMWTLKAKEFDTYEKAQSYGVWSFQTNSYNKNARKYDFKVERLNYGTDATQRVNSQASGNWRFATGKTNKGRIESIGA